MRIVSLVTAALVLAAGSLWAQAPREVTGPRNLKPAHPMCTDLPVVTPPVPRLVIKGGHNSDRRHSLTGGDLLVVGRTLDDGLSVGQRYTARRHLGAPGRFAGPDEGFGAIHNAGWVTITSVDELNALAVIDFVCDAIEPGDFLEPFAEVPLPTAAAPLTAPNFDDRARILFGQDRRKIFGDGDIFSIDRGTINGVTLGARFAIYRDHLNGTPLVHIGEAVVIEPGEMTSKAVLVRVKDVVEVGDVAVSRR